MLRDALRPVRSAQFSPVRTATGQLPDELARDAAHDTRDRCETTRVTECVTTRFVRWRRFVARHRVPGESGCMEMEAASPLLRRSTRKDDGFDDEYGTLNETPTRGV